MEGVMCDRWSANERTTSSQGNFNMARQSNYCGVHFDMRPLNRVIDGLTETRHLGVVYSLTCDRTQRSYIGITTLCYGPKTYESGRSITRFQTHLRLLRKGCHECRELQADWDKYPEHEFSFGILSILEADTTWRSDRVLRHAEYECHLSSSNTYSRPSFDPAQRTWAAMLELRQREFGVYAVSVSEDLYGEDF